MGKTCVICNKKTENYIYICENEKDRVLEAYRNDSVVQNRLRKLSEDYESIKKELQEKNNEFNNSRIELLKLKNYEIKYKDFLKNYEGNKKNADEFYDTILGINSILEINKGWEIKFNSKKGKEEYEKMKSEEILKVGVIGNGNKGKSFFLSKISDYELPTGTSIRTEGLSLKFPEPENSKKIILMDSAGFETPLIDNNNLRNLDKENFIKELENSARDKLITEKFLQNFILWESDILICVIGILTYNEQKLINRIKNDLLKYNINKKLYIIHNLQTFTEKKQVESYIKDYLKKSLTFNLKENNVKSFEGVPNQNYIYFYEKSENNLFSNNVETYHFIIANDNSDAGEYYNKFVFKYFKDLYKTIINMSSFPLTDKLMKYFENFSTLITDNKISKE